MDTSNSSNVQLDLRSGHGDGFTEFAFTPESCHLLTGGVDGECRLWKYGDDGQYSEDAESFSVGDAIYGVVCDKQNFYVATETLDVKTYDLTNGNYEGSLVKFSAEVYCISMSPDMTTVAAGSADFKIKLVTLKDHSVKVLRGHEAPILSVSFDPSGKLLASSSCDGSVRVWNVETTDEEHKWMHNHAATSDRCYTNSQARMSWNPVDVTMLALPSNDQIKLYKQVKTNEWKMLSMTQSQPALITVASLTSFSSTGSLLALACGETGNIAIWHSASLSSSPLAVMVREESIPVTAMLFHPKEKDVMIFTDKNGKYGLLKVEKSSSHRENLDSLVDDLCAGNKESNVQSKSHSGERVEAQTKASTYEIANDVEMAEMISQDTSTQDEASSEKKSNQRSIHDEDDSEESDDEAVVKISRKKASFIDEEADEKNADSEGASDEESGNDALDAADFINDDEEDEGELVNEKEKTKNAPPAPSEGKNNEDEDDFDDGSTFNEDDMIAALADVEPPPPPSKSVPGASSTDGKSQETGAVDIGDVDFDDDMDVSDIGALKAQYEKLINPDDDESPKPDVNVTNKLNGEASSKIVKVESYTQRSFQAGSTPLGIESRFMLWNDIGIVKAYSGENGAEDTIEVVFHDHSIHHSINLDNRLNYTIAALSAESFVLATQYDDTSVDDDTNSSKLLCMNFTAWDGRNKEWNVTLPDEEYVEGLAIGTGFIAVSTDKRYLRLFTIGGTQTYILSVPGNVVCSSASENSLMIVYNTAAGHLKNNPSLSAMLIKVNAKSAYPMKQPLTNPVPLALTPNCTLYWAGFTDEGTPCIVDSAGVVRLLKTHFGNCWMPIVNMKEDLTNKCDNYFVISVSEISQNVRCLFCKGSRYPSMFPYPTLTNVPFALPFISRGSNRGALEERAGRAKLFTSLFDRLYNEGKDVESALEDNYRIHSTALLGLFTLALTNNCESLALEIANLMPSGQDVFTAIQCAVGKRCMALANKLRQVALEKDGEAKEYEDEQQAAVAPQGESYHVSPKKSVVPEISKDDDAVVLRPKKVTSITQRKEPQDTASSSGDTSDGEADGGEREEEANESDVENQPATTSANTRKSKSRREEDNDFINDDSSEGGQSDDGRDDRSSLTAQREKKGKKESKGKKASGKKKASVPANPFEAAKGANKRKADSTAGFEMFFEEKLEQIRDESGMDDEDYCRILAQDMFKDLPLRERNEWEEKAQCKSSKKAKR